MNQWDKNKLYNLTLDILDKVKEIRQLPLSEKEKNILSELQSKNLKLYQRAIDQP